MGEWISILEEILTLGTKAMRHPAFFICYMILQDLKNVFLLSLNQTIMKCHRLSAVLLLTKDLLSCFAHFAVYP